MRVPERPIRHERIIEMLRIHGISFQSGELRELCLHQMKIRIKSIVEVDEMRWHTNSAGSQGSDDSGGIPQSSTPSIGGGCRRARIRASSSWNLSEDEGGISIDVEVSLARVKVHGSNSDVPYALILGLPTPTMPFNLGCRGAFQRIYQGTNC